MEERMKKKEQEFRVQATEARRQTNDDEFTVNEIRKKEMELARERGDAVVKLKDKREKLEAERNRIMNDLKTIKNGGTTFQDPNHARNNLRSAGLELINPTDREMIDPAMKDKMIADQVRINHL